MTSSTDSPITPTTPFAAPVTPPDAARRPAGPVLVACDGSPFADGLFNAARLAAEALGGGIQVLGVCEPTPLAPTVGGGVVASPNLDSLRRQTFHDDVQRAVSIAAAGDPAWPVEVLLGSPPETLAREAERRGAPLVVMGIGRHNPLDRLLGTETTIGTLRRSRVPILAVGASFSPFPRHAIIGVDFSPACLRAAKLAIRLLGEAGRLTLTHVRPRFDHPSADWRAWDQEYGRTLTPLFADFVEQLDAPPGLTVETRTVRGDPAPALLAFAQQADADLIAIGAQRHGALDRLLVGSVASRILRNARIATLAAPAPLVAGAAGLAPEGARVESSEEPRAWVEMLDHFARTNRGRPAVLEVGAADGPLQPVVTDLRFCGASAEPDRSRVRVLLDSEERRANAAANGTGPADDAAEREDRLAHFAHEDHGVRRVSIVRDVTGRDLGLRVRHGRGVTRLSFRED